MPEVAREIADLRELLRASADDRGPTEWWMLAVADVALASKSVPLLDLAEPGSRARQLVAEGLRFRTGLVAAYILEFLDELERREGLSGPIGNRRMAGAEVSDAIDELSAAVHGGER